jgi:hypothetical protein
VACGRADDGHAAGGTANLRSRAARLPRAAPQAATARFDQACRAIRAA